MTAPAYKNNSALWHQYAYSQMMCENLIPQIQKEMESLHKRINKLKAVAIFASLQSTSFNEINCFVSNIHRYKSALDDIATIHIKTDDFHTFEVCINQHNDFKVQQIAYRVHNLSLPRRISLVKALSKVSGLEASHKIALLIHRARNFEIRKV